MYMYNDNITLLILGKLICINLKRFNAKKF